MKLRKYKKEKEPEFKSNGFWIPPPEKGTPEYYEKIYKKWKPINEALKIKNEELQHFIAKYAEYHLSSDGNGGYNEIFQNLLPVSLKIISKLNLKDKIIEIKDEQPTISLTLPLTHDTLQDIKSATGMDVIQKLENQIIEKVVDYLNEELKTKNNLYVTKIISNINIISDNEYEPMAFIYTRYSVE